MTRLINLTGAKFGRLVVIERAENDRNGLVRWRCLCTCGREVVVRGQDLRRGRQVSCGCWKDQNTTDRNTRHGETGTRLHRIWKNMKSRCYNPRVACFKNYGGRGITICAEWLSSFKSFHDWAMTNGYRDDLSIDRVDVNGNYEPNNCRWATAAEQAHNTRKTAQKEATP